VEDGRVGDGVFGLPSHFFGQTIMFDTDAIDDAGAEWPIAEATWDQLADVLRTVHAETGLWGAQDPTIGDTHRHMEAWIRQHGEELFDHDTGQFGFSQETYISWLEFWDELRQEGVISPADDELARTGHEEAAMVTGDAGFYIASTNHYPIVVDLVPDRAVDMTEVPGLDGGDLDWRFFPSALLSISAHTAEPEWSARLVDFFLNDLDAAEITEVSHGAPSSEDVREHLIPLLPDAQARFLEQIGSEMEMDRRPFPVRPAGAGEINTALQRLGEAVAFGTITPQEAAEELWEVADEALDVDPDEIDLD
jgi:multiple sugar transport system substrate-binding protein